MENRVIKFRAWDKRLRLMSDVSVIEYDRFNPTTPIYIRGKLISHIDESLTNKVYQEYQTGSSTREEILVGDVIIMQFTGFHDKTGKEIYEGDIVEVQGQSTTPKRNLYTIVFDNGAFIGQSIKEYEVQGKGKRWLKLLLWNDCDMLTANILGNIYESPHLTQTK